MSPKSWKQGLLSSSLPLEFEAAKILVKLGFEVYADYAYGRYDSNILKDFSVDIHAYSFPGHRAVFHLLVECKYKTPNKKWLFLPDPNKDEFSKFIPGHTVRFVDEFSAEYFGKRDSTRGFESCLPTSYKGTEINLADGTVYDTDIKHGVAQLRYALPRLFKDQVVENVAMIGEGIPFIICPVLVTTAELFLMHSRTSLAKVAKSSSIDQLGKRVPFVILHSDYGPDFEIHCRSREFLDLGQLVHQFENSDELKSIEASRRKIKGRGFSHNMPSQILKGLVDLNHMYMNRYFTQFFVTQFSELPSLIDDLKRSVSKTVRTLRKIPRRRTKPE